MASGVKRIIYTDIARDGMLTGPDVTGLAKVLETTNAEVIASGGVGSIDDLLTLAGLEAGGRRLAGVIVGKAIYEGVFSVADAVRVLT